MRAEVFIEDINDEYYIVKGYGNLDVSSKIKIHIFEVHFDYNKNISKPKWSVGTYVEMLENTDEFFIKGELYQIIPAAEEYPFSVGLKLMSDTPHIKGTPISKYSLDSYIHSGKIEWHENKPEKKIDKAIAKNIEESTKYPFGKPKIKNDLYERYGKSPIEGILNIIHDRKGYKSEWTEEEQMSCAYYGGCDPIYGSGDFDGTTLQDAVDFMKCQPYPVVPNADWKVKDFLECFNKTGLLWSTSAEFKDHRDILQKPEITISKQKQIKININKPKI